MVKIGKEVGFLLIFMGVCLCWSCGYKAAETQIKPEKEEVSMAVEIVPIETIPTEPVEITEEEEVLIYEHRTMDTADIYVGDDTAEPEPAAETETEEEVHSAGYTFTEDEIWEMTRIVYLENGIVDESTDTTLYLTACVILNRLYDWDECDTVYEVIWERGQYSTADRYTDYDGSDLGSSYPYGWERSYNAVCQAIENCDRNPHFQSMFAQGAVYYTDPNTGEVFCY